MKYMLQIGSSYFTLAQTTWKVTDFFIIYSCVQNVLYATEKEINIL